MKNALKILVFEDKRIVAEDIKISLKKLGYTVDAALISGEEALQIVAEIHPDLVLMDIMPANKNNGIDNAEKIRARYNIPIVFVTAYADKKLLNRFKKTEPYGYIIKPFDDRELQNTIEMAFYKHSMEQKLKESEARYSTTLKSIGDAVITTDTKGIVTFMNPVAETMTGWKYKESLGKPVKNILNIIHEETGQSVENSQKRVLQEDIIDGLASHKILIDKNGNKIPVEGSGASIKGDTDNTIGVVIVFHKISERNKAQKALLHYAGRLKSLREIDQAILEAQSADEIAQVALDHIHRLIPCQRASIVLFNFKTDQCLVLATLTKGKTRVGTGTQMPLTAFDINPELRNGETHVVDDIRLLSEPSSVAQQLQAEGIRSFISVPLLVQGKLNGCLNLGVNKPAAFTEEQIEIAREVAVLLALATRQAHLHEQVQRHAEELERRIAERTSELRESFERTRAQYESIPVPTYTWQKIDEGFVLVDYNDASMAITQGKISEYLGIKASQLYADMPEIQQEMERCLSDQITIEREMAYKYKSTGIIKHLAVKYAYVPPDSVLVHTEDITERKVAEEEIKKLNENISQWAAELEAANKELESFSYSVSQDLRASLRAINKFSQKIAERYKDKLDEEGHHYINKIIEASNHIDHLINDLLTYSRLGRSALRKPSVELNELLAQVTENLSESIKQIGAEFNIADDLPTISGDRILLTQIFTNLIENALLYQNPDSCPQITINTQIRGKHAVIQVQDNGIGISPKFHKKIFNLFQRLHNQDEYPGTGVGLAIVKKSVELLGGQVWIESSEGKGSTFFVELPIGKIES